MLGPTKDDACRICLDGSTPADPLVLKCGCRGSSGWVHDGCLARWRRMPNNAAEAAYQCGSCKDDYRDALSLELLGARLSEQRGRLGNRGNDTLATMSVLGLQLHAQRVHGRERVAAPVAQPPALLAQPRAQQLERERVAVVVLA